jgi:catechol 2,3-dioxygenase-like lactoylglutathione lyase family enzyme
MDKDRREVQRILRLPRVRQIGVVVNDMGRAVSYFSETFGLGPWFRPHFSRTEHKDKGTRVINTDLDIVMAFSGPIQYELIQPKGPDRSFYQDHLDRHGEGIHHLGFYVSDMEKRLVAVKKLGIGILQAGVIESKGKSGGSVTDYAYLDTTEIGGIVFELIRTRFMGIPIGMSRFWFEMGTLMGDLDKIPG